jgi:hypothetical protein
MKISERKTPEVAHCGWRSLLGIVCEERKFGNEKEVGWRSCSVVKDLQANWCGGVT